MQLLQDQGPVANWLLALVKRKPCYFKSPTIPSFLLSVRATREQLQTQNTQEFMLHRLPLVEGSRKCPDDKEPLQLENNEFSINITSTSLNHQSHTFFHQGVRYDKRRGDQALGSTRLRALDDAGLESAPPRPSPSSPLLWLLLLSLAFFCTLSCLLSASVHSPES